MKKFRFIIALAIAALAFTSSAVPVGTPPVHRPIMEEYTGTWCGWCVRGIVGMGLLREQLGEEFIGVAYHNSDPMQIMNQYGYPNTINGFPSAFLDRTHSVDAYYGFGDTPGGIVSDYQALADIATTAGIEVVAHWTSDAKTEISVDMTTYFTENNTNAKYALEVMLGADDLYGTASGWNQANYYSGYSSYNSDPYLKPWVSRPSTVSGLHFNDVLIFTSSRISSSIPTTITAYEDYTYNYTFPLTKLQKPALVQNKDNLYIVVLVVDTSNGKVINANKCLISDYVEPIMIGDVDGNGIVSIDDVTALINYLLSHDETGINLANANVEDDEKVDIADVTALISMLLTKN